ncbi:MAG: hypothetical protein ACI9XO_001409 [Paraglaciecola sp.]|jgi:hypothetical protein
MTLNLKIIGFVLVTATLFTACKTTKPIRPIENYDSAAMERQTSVIHIPVRIDKNELQMSINQQLGETLYEDNNMGDDDMMIRAKKQQDITIEIGNEELIYQVPLDLWIKKGTFLGSVEAEGQLILDFKTSYQIAEDWSLSTITEVVGYDWIKRPVLKLGIVDLPVQFIANQVLKKTRSLISRTIDEQVKKQLDLKTQVNEAWQKLHQPILLSEEHKTWIVFNPESIGMSPLKLDKDTIESTIIFKSNPVVSLGNKPATPAFQPLPNFVFEIEKSDGFTLYLNTNFSLAEAEDLSKKHLVGEQFSYGKKYVKIEDVELYGSGKDLVINLLLSGSYNGNVYVQGEPKYNKRTNEIELENLDFDFSSKRFLMRTMSWLFKSNLKDRIHHELNFQLGQNVEMARLMIQEQLKSMEISKGVMLKGNLDKIHISKVKIVPETLKVEVALNGNLLVDMKGIGQN